MDRLINKYLNKLQSQGLSHPSETVFIACDDKVYSNTDLSGSIVSILNGIDLNSLIIARPLSPYREIVESLLGNHERLIIPEDCETRTFLHDIPIVEKIDAESVIQALSKRRSALSRDGLIISYSMVSPEQAYVNLSSTCFSLFVKFFLDLITEKNRQNALILNHIREIPAQRLQQNSIFETGKALVRLGLVDSYFGNISFVEDSAILISQTGSSLDELEDAVDVVPLDMSSTTGITASSEFSTHRAIYSKTDYRYIVHGHPKFIVIQSMLCGYDDCVKGDVCYQSCRRQRDFEGIPIVSGEIGTGPNSLLNTVPDAMTRSHAVIVYGHGIFVASKEGFQDCLDELIRIENNAIRSLRAKIASYNEP